MAVIDKEDLDYVEKHAPRKLIGLKSITFWMSSAGQLIGTSLKYEDSAIFWIDARRPKEAKQCKDHKELLMTIKPRKGTYLAYMRDNLAFLPNQWFQVGTGPYNHENVVLHINNTVLPDRFQALIEQQEALLKE